MPKVVDPQEDQIDEALLQRQFLGEFSHLKQTMMIVNNYIDNHLTDLEQPLTKKDFDELKILRAERQLKDTFAHKMVRKLLPKTVKCLDTIKA